MASESRGVPMTPPGYPELVRNDIGAFVRKTPYVSVDFEFNPKWPLIPTETGISAGHTPHTAVHSAEARRVLDRLDREGVTWVGHNALTTERQILEAELGRAIPLERMEDTMILHYCANAHLCKGAAKDEDEQDPRGQGFMDLWSMSSLYTDLPQWKRCRGSRCAGPCPVHDHLGYNGVDAYAVDVAYPSIIADLATKGVSRAYIDHVKRTVTICDKMSAKGIKVDRPLVRSLEREMFERKDKLFPSSLQPAFGKPNKKFPEGRPLKNPVLVWDAPFNPRASAAVKEWFNSRGVNLESTEKEEIKKHWDRFEEDPNNEVYVWLDRLYEFKSEGKGLGPWFDDRYFHADGLMHPRFNATGTSTGRLASSNPNFQNIPARGFGKNVRRVVVPRDPSLIIAEADKSQLELRMCLYHAGMLDLLPPKEDAFTWMVKEGNGIFEMAAEMRGGGKTARDQSKRVSHASDYGEGIKVLFGRDLDSSYNKRLIEAGALIVHRDWEFMGGVVAFTGSNLAQEFFGSTSWENRKKALEIQEAYFNRFAPIRTWQRRVSRQAQEGYIKAPDGSYLQLHGSPEDKLKIAFAKLGQGCGATDVQESMIRYDEQGYTPLIQVHDSLAFEFDRTVSNDYLLQFFSIMSAESKFMPGFRCPVKVKRGDNWLDMEEIGAA
jgi:DNA polymerase I-like protein with 3'-5' exonuclease and polymerase domains